MKIKLLIASADSDYAEHFSNILSEKYSDVFAVSVCSSTERLRDMLTTEIFNVALLESSFSSAANLDTIHLPLLLVDETEAADSSRGMKKICKYQRISSIAGNVFENYAEAGKSVSSFNAARARITAVWSPAGGTGKTTVALAYSTNAVSKGKQAVYLNFENFSSTSAYFRENGRSISKAFERLESNIHLFLMGIRQQDSGSGISYFCGPENYDDISILTANDIEKLINACATEIDELIVDLSSQCDDRVQRALELADTVLIVCDPSNISKVKLKQFVNQHNVFGQIHAKTVLVNNKDAKTTESSIDKVIQLPFVQSPDPISIYKTLSGGNFDW
jgi:cellulose biosynthesis protein BcsQ